MATTETKKTVKKSELTLSLYNLKGEEAGSMELPKNIFGVVVNKPLMAQSVRVYQANQRGGNASTKSRGEVTGSTRKIYRQKGTGKARHGSIKAPIFVGGGVVGGPRPKDFSLSFNKVQRQKALFSSLTFKLKEKELLGLKESEINKSSKTKVVYEFLKKLKLVGKNVVFVVSKLEKNNFILSARNIEKISITDSTSLNSYQVLSAKTVIFFESAVVELEKHFIKAN